MISRRINLILGDRGDHRTREDAGYGMPDCPKRWPQTPSLRSRQQEAPGAIIVKKFQQKLIINWAGSTWMNDATTEDYLRRVIGGTIFSENRLLVWDAFASHKSEGSKDKKGTKAVLKELNIHCF